MTAPALRRYWTSEAGRPRRSEPHDWKTTPFLRARSSGSVSRSGARVSPAWKWKTSKRGSAHASARSCFGRLNGIELARLVSRRRRLTSYPRSNGRSLNTSSVLSTPSSRSPAEIAPGPPATFTGECSALNASLRSSNAHGWRFQTDARAELARPEVGIASDASDDGRLGGDLDVERRERAVGQVVEFLFGLGREEQVAEALRAGGHRRQRHPLAPVPAGLVHAVERERGRRVQPDDVPGLVDDEAHLPDGRLRLAVAEVLAAQLAEGPEHVRPDRVEAGHELRQLRVLAAPQPRPDLDRPRLAVLNPDLDVRRPGLQPDRAARGVRELEDPLLLREARRVAMGDADAERRRRVQQPLGDAHREVVALEQEAVDSELLADEVLLENDRAGLRSRQGAVDRRAELALLAHLGHAALRGAVHRLHDQGRAELVERLLGLFEGRRLAPLRAAHLRPLEGRAHA